MTKILVLCIGLISCGNPIDIQLDKVQKTLITGRNGGGKSTMLEALYGTQRSNRPEGTL